MTTIGLGLAGLSIVLVRWGWDRSRLIALIGWGVAAIALALLAASDGAWGLAAGCTVGMAIAVTLVLMSAWRSPAKSRRVPRDVASVTLALDGSDLRRRFTVFGLVGPVSFAAAQWLAFGIQALMHDGTQTANSIALTFFLQPVVWTILMIWQMALTGPRKMWVPPAIAAALGTLFWITA